ncbi:hypothetical protein [Limnovirga soli]|uniref:Uncharacterized protein n=1 Tax=Limnovirga soli TaxID=2656915 RepID=A0A8J8JUN0_9BACT|nr:hypothetical protein [Limnovirga soli]NNV57198.1 hypothetical protein [Limnovirga soli]
MQLLELCEYIKTNIDELDKTNLNLRINNAVDALSRYYPSDHNIFHYYWEIRKGLNKLKNKPKDLLYQERFEQLKPIVVNFVDRVISEIHTSGLPDDKIWSGFIVEIARKNISINTYKELSLALSYTYRNDDFDVNKYFTEKLSKADSNELIKTLSEIFSHPAVVESFFKFQLS